MVAKGEYDLMANRSHRRLPTLLSVRAHQHEAGGMIRDQARGFPSGPRALLMPPIQQAGYMTATRSPQPFLTLARGRGPYMTVGSLPGVATALVQFTQPAASGIWAVAVAATLPLDRPINLKKA